jgi:hypothetical protein
MKNGASCNSSADDRALKVSDLGVYRLQTDDSRLHSRNKTQRQEHDVHTKRMVKVTWSRVEKPASFD